MNSTTAFEQEFEQNNDSERVVLSEKEHPILEKDIESEALKVLYRLRDAGYAGYLVGGGVRDLYLGNKPKDFDISTNARPGQLRKLFRNSRTIGRRFRLVQVFFRGNKIIEVSTLRSRSEYDSDEPDKVLPANNTFGTLEEDAYRRDLTINSLFYEIENNTVIDYVGGVQDLTDGIIRIVGEPEQRIIRDPVRILRAIRHAARNGFTIEEKTLEAITKHLEKLDLCPTSRIRDELLKDLRGGTSQAWVGLALQTGVFATLFPFYQELFQHETEGEAVKKELLSLFAALDNIEHNIERVTLEDAMLFAILLFPWALRRFDLLHQELKGQGYHRLSKAIRADLDQLFARRLNIKRAIKDKITTLFVNMSSLQKHRTKDTSKDTWPAWLRRKSYFKDCSRFYALYQESISNEQSADSADIAHFVEDAPKAKRQEKIERPVGASTSGNAADKPQRGGRRGNNPAFSSDKQGVFGLRTV